MSTLDIRGGGFVMVSQICRFLNINEEYRLLEICDALKCIINDFLWRYKYKEVNIQIFSENDFIVTKEINDIIDIDVSDPISIFLADIRGRYGSLPNRTVYFNNAEDMHNFLNLNKNNIKKLKIISQTGRCERFLLNQDLKYLTYLSCKRIEMKSEELKYVADNFKNIETLELLNCNIPDNDKSLQILESMQSLKDLKLILIPRTNELTFKNIVNQLQLEMLFLNYANFSNNETEINVDKLTNYKAFEVEQIENFLYFQTELLKYFENLKYLSVNYATISQSFFDILLTSCGNLTDLSLKHCEVFHFTALPKLRILDMRNCSGLRFGNLKTILSEMNLSRFVATTTVFAGDFEPFYISPTLRHIQIYSANDNITRLFNFNSNPKLVNLTKFHSIWHYLQKTEFSLKFAPNLLEVYMLAKLMKIRHILELKHLQKLVVSVCRSTDMPKIHQLMKHDTLRELSILYYIVEDNIRIHANQIETKLLKLNIPGTMLALEADYVLDLLTANTQLSLSCTLFNLPTIGIMLRNKKFPKRFKSINVCGFLMDHASAQFDESKQIEEPFRFFGGKYYFILE